MKYLKSAVMLTLTLLMVATAQQGPQSQPSETVAKPKKTVPAETPADTDQPPIPSQYKKDKEATTNLPTPRRR